MSSTSSWPVSCQPGHAWQQEAFGESVDEAPVPVVVVVVRGVASGFGEGSVSVRGLRFG